MHKNPVGEGKILVNTVLAAHCTTCGSVRTSRTIRAALAIVTAALLFVCGIFGGLSWLPVAGGVLKPMTAHAAVSATITINQSTVRIEFSDGTSSIQINNFRNDSGGYLDLLKDRFGYYESNGVTLIGRNWGTEVDSILLRLESNVDVSGFYVYDKPVTIDGSYTLSVDNYMVVRDNASLTLNNGVTLNVNNGNNQTIINNQGTININGYFTNYGNATINNSGTLTSNGTFNNYSSITNSGAITNSGTLNNDGGTVTNNGTITNSSTLNNNAGGTVTNNDTIINTGTLDNTSGTIHNQSGNIYNAGGTISGSINGNSVIQGLPPAPPVPPTPPTPHPPAAPAPSPQGEGSCATGHASYTWQTVTEPDVHNDGEEICVCEGCGQVLYRVPLSAYVPFQKVTAEKIRNAAQGATVEITTSRWYSFHRSVMEALAARPDVTLVISFLSEGYKGDRLILTIPAGTDTVGLLNEDGYAGFFYISWKLGTLRPAN